MRRGLEQGLLDGPDVVNQLAHDVHLRLSVRDNGDDFRVARQVVTDRASRGDTGINGFFRPFIVVAFQLQQLILQKYVISSQIFYVIKTFLKLFFS
jgi:hypothetical protein